MKRRIRWLAGWLVGTTAIACFAHTYPYSTLELRITARGLEGTLQGHVISYAHPLGATSIGDLLDDSFVNKHRGKFAAMLNRKGALTIVADGRTLKAQVERVQVSAEKQQLTTRVRFPWAKRPARLDLTCAVFTSTDPTHETYLRLYDGESLTQATFTQFKPKHTCWRGTRQAKWAVFRAYARDGIHHIFTGYDHLAFIIGLLLLGGTLGRLTKIVTAFTLAHSITLTLAALGLVHLSPKFIEPAIALSIAYVGADNLVADEKRDWRAWIAFFFGFIHGFGFAGVLRETGLPQRAVGLSLFSFNFGVEIGQVCIVLLVAPALEVVGRRSAKHGRGLVIAGSWAIVLAGGYWFIERMWLAP